MLDELFVSQSSFDWDQFLVKDDYAEGDADIDNTPASAVLSLRDSSPTSDNDSSPKSTESEQSQALDSSNLGLFDFDFDLPAGIAHDPKDILASLSASTPAVPDETMSTDPTMLSTFASLGDFGSLSTIGNDAVNQLQLGNILSQLTAPSAPAPTVSSGLTEAYAALGWPSSKDEKAALSATSMKRKASDMSNDGSKRARASATPVPKRPYRRQSKNGLSLSQLAAAASSGSPLVVDDCLTPGSPEEVEDDIKPVRLTASGKPSTARPKAVVPEKYMKNGEAQAITGMTTEQIMAFPNWSTLMECVDEEHRAGSDIFGKMISENRDKAKWAAKKSRDERKAKVESLESEVADLQGKINEMRGVLLGLVGRGAVSLSEIENYI